MTEEAMDLRQFLQIAWRYKAMAIVAAALGLAGGIGFTLLNPPHPNSQALVLLPPTPTLAIGTQLVVAGSDPVLAGAIPRVHPPARLPAMRAWVKVGGLTSNIMSITAKGRTARQAENIANAVADSYVDYVARTSSAVGPVRAEVLARANSASVGSLDVRLLGTGGLGAIVGLLAGTIGAAGVARKRFRLRARDQIADATGAPVLASIPIEHPSGATAWTRLLDEYRPKAMHVSGLRKTLERAWLVAGKQTETGHAAGCSVAVLSISSDPAALAIGPQLAVFAASAGMPTTLAVAVRSDTNVPAGLLAACTSPTRAGSRRSTLLHVRVAEPSAIGTPPAGQLTVIVGVISSRIPQVSDIMPTTRTLLAVSAGGVTSEQLAGVAAAIAADGRAISGILVGDPDPADSTTGRVPQLAWARGRMQPSRLAG